MEQLKFKMKVIGLMPVTVGRMIKIPNEGNKFDTCYRYDFIYLTYHKSINCFRNLKKCMIVSSARPAHCRSSPGRMIG